jgi:predicted small secreted protein
MRKLFARLVLATPLALGAVTLTAGCNEGPAEKAGENLDQAGKDIRDAVDPPSGPGEKAGRAIDDAADKVGNP